MEGARKRVWEHGGRYFAAGIRADPTAHYFVEPEVKELFSDLSRGKYCILTGHRQAGKSTSVVYCMQELAKTGVLPVIFSRGISGAEKTWSAETMWQRLCRLLHQACKQYFPPVQPGRAYSSEDFVEAFRADVLPVQVVLVIDEADTLLSLNESCIDEFLHNVRGLKSDQGAYNLRTMVLVGTDRVKDLIELRCHEAAKQPGDGPSVSTYSQFPHDHALSPVRFTVRDIEVLLEQFAEDYPDAGVEVSMIASSIFELTGGHKGLAGTCLAFMDQERAYTAGQWESLVVNNRLVTHVFSLATYQRVMQAVRENGGLPQQFRTFVEHSRVRYNLGDSLWELRDYLSSGVLIVEEAAPYCYVKLSSPLLRMAILGRLKVGNYDLGKQPPRDKLQTEDDRVWVLTAALEFLDGNILRAAETWLDNDTPSEYSYQFAFMARLKLVLEQAYPLMGLRVLPEVREVRRPGLARSLLRADSLVVGGPEFQPFSAQFLVFGTLGPRGTLMGHYKRALLYAAQHSAVVYLVNITLDKDFNDLVPEDPSVVFVGVRFTTGNSSARVKLIYSPSLLHPPLDLTLTLKKWTGELDYHML